MISSQPRAVRAFPRVIAPSLLSTVFFVLGATEGCGNSTTCGRGTELVGTQCLPLTSGTGGASTGTGGASTGTGGNTGGTSTGGSGGTTTSASCTTQCDCFSGTACAISGTCEAASGSLIGACDDTCQTSADCPCGRSCDQGVCAMPTTPMFAGAGTPCQADCECPGDGGNAQRCIGGRCVIPCNVIGPQCTEDAACSACGKVCLGNGSCGSSGQCSIVTDCLAQPSAVCAGGHCTPPSGTRYATMDVLPAGKSPLEDRITLTVNVPSGVQVHGIVVALDTLINPSLPASTGAIQLKSPNGTTVTLATSFQWSVAQLGNTRVTYPSLAAPPPPQQPDLSPFEGQSGSGVWTFTLDSPMDLVVTDLALYIE